MKQVIGKSSGVIRAIGFFAIVASLLIVVVIGLHYVRGKSRFYVESAGQGTYEVFPLNQPNVTTSSLLKWATQAATSAYTLDFFNYKDNIEALREYFTIAGYNGYLKSLNDSDSLNRIIEDKLIMSAVATNTAIILAEGENNGTYTWNIQVPLLLNYQGASTESAKKNIVVGLLVTRVPTDQAPKGIGIAQIVDGGLSEQP